MAMHPFVAVMLGLGAGLVIAWLAIGRFYPGSGGQQLDWQPARSPQLEAQNEIDDLEQMREAINVRRRARGAPELTEQALRERVVDDLGETRQRRHESQPR